jgi:O-antigen biosynthesis protein
MLRTAYPDYEIIVVDNGSKEPSLLRYLEDRAFDVRLLRDNRPFNYSQLNNDAVRNARGSVVCLLNDDIEIISEGWLNELVGQLLQPGVGLVGAKLYFPDGSIQHAGVVLGVGGVATHGFRFADGLSAHHFGHTVVSRSVSAVTAACMVVRREVWEELGGLDECLAVSYNDVDFCLRARKKGWRVVWTPFAELLHSESTSRGSDAEAHNVERARKEHMLMSERWSAELEFDPMYNPNLTLDDDCWKLSWPPRIDPSSPLIEGSARGLG